MRRTRPLTLRLKEARWNDHEKMLLSQKNEVETRLNDLEARNKVLHDQIQAHALEEQLVQLQEKNSELTPKLRLPSLKMLR